MQAQVLRRVILGNVMSAIQSQMLCHACESFWRTKDAGEEEEARPSFDIEIVLAENLLASHKYTS